MSEADAARRLVAQRALGPAAFGHLTEALMGLPFEALGPTKTLLKRYLSAEPWGRADDEALAAAVGPGEGRWSRPLDAGVTLDYGWDGGRFGVRVRAAAQAEPPAVEPDEDSVGATFEGPVVPEATPNPRSIRFRLGGQPHDGPSRWYDSAEAAITAGDASAIRLFSTFDEVANVLVGPGFVNVSLRRAPDWERLLHGVLTVVTEEFAARTPVERPPQAVGTGHRATTAARRSGRLEEAWNELGALRPADDPADLARLEAAARAGDPFRRQVAAYLLGEADPGRAAAAWAELVRDPSRLVRRAAVDAAVDAGRQELRPLLEHALNDVDPWIRWKALRGLAELGAAPSRDAVAALADDPDFRVRLEVAAALRSPRPGNGPGCR